MYGGQDQIGFGLFVGKHHLHSVGGPYDLIVIGQGCPYGFVVLVVRFGYQQFERFLLCFLFMEIYLLAGYHFFRRVVGKGKGEGTSFPYFGGNGDAAFELLHDCFTDGQSQARALHKIVGLNKAVEHFIYLFRGDTRSGICDVEPDRVCFLLVSIPYASFAGKLERVSDEVGEYLKDTVLIGMDADVGGLTLRRSDSLLPGSGICARRGSLCRVYEAVREPA